jgi:hypothetical protein
MISASFIVKKDDVLALALHYYSASPAFRKARLRVQLGVPMMFSLVAALMLYRDAGQSAPAAIALLILSAVWALFYPRYHNGRIRRTAEKMFKESAYQKAFGAYSLTLNDDGFVCSSPIGEGKYSWSAVNRVLLTTGHLLIFLTGPSGYPISRIQVPNSTILEIKEFVEKRIPGTGPIASPNSRHATPIGNSGVTKGPPSVI